MVIDSWKQVTLGEQVDLLTGFPFKSDEYTEDITGFPLVRGDNVVQGMFRWNDVKRWPRDKTEALSDYFLIQGDVVLAMDRPWIEAGLKYSYVSAHDVPCLLVQRVSRLRAKATLDQNFLRYVIGSPEFTSYILGIQTGTAVPHISSNQIKGYQFLLPPLPEQRAIASILSALDDKIELNRRTNATLESIARTMFREWFVDSEGVKDWEIGTVGHDFNLTMGQSPPGETYNKEGIGMPFFQGRADFEFRFPSNRVYCTSPTRFANYGDTLVCVRAPVGDVNMASEICAIGRGIAAIRHKTGSRSYTYYAMRSLEEDFKQFEADGTVFGSINKADFQHLQIVIPPFEVVENFEEICFPIDQMIENNENESRTLASLRDTLLPKLMRGEVRVKDGKRP